MSSILGLSEASLFYLDVEYGNASYFYSGVKQKGSAHLGGAFVCSRDYEWEGNLVHTNLNLYDNLRLSDKHLDRRLLFHVREDSRLFDFVSRFVVYSNDSRPGRINGKEYVHRSNNIYYQFPIGGEVSVPVGESGRLQFESIGAEIPSGFNEVFYIRDEGRDENGYRWIVHHRLIVDPNQVRLVLRSCNPRFEGPLPYEQYLPNRIKRPLFRIRESHYPSFPIMTVGEAHLLAGDRVSIRTAVELVSD